MAGEGGSGGSDGVPHGGGALLGDAASDLTGSKGSDEEEALKRGGHDARGRLARRRRQLRVTGLGRGAGVAEEHERDVRWLQLLHAAARWWLSSRGLVWVGCGQCPGWIFGQF